MNLEEARKIVREQDVQDPLRTIEAVALVLRFEGIADPNMLIVAKRLEMAVSLARSAQVLESGNG